MPHHGEPRPVGPAPYTVIVDIEAGDYVARDPFDDIVSWEDDAATVILAAVAEVGAAGGTIFLKRGEYPVSQLITLTDRIHLEGENWRASNLIAEAPYAGNIIEVDGLFVTISRLGIQGLENNGYGIYSTQFWGGQLNEVYLVDLDHGIYIDTTNNYVINRCRMGGCTVGAYLKGGHDIIFTDNSIETAIDRALWLQSISASVFSNNVIENGGVNTAFLSYVSECPIIGNEFHGDADSTGDMVYCSTFSKNRFIGNYLGEACGASLLRLIASENNLIKDNVFEDAPAGSYDIEYSGVANLEDIILGNQCLSTLSAASIEATGMGAGGIIAFNHLENGILTPPTTISILGNEGYNPQAASTPAVGASPVTFGPYAYPVFIEVVGDVTSVTIRAQASARPAAGAYEAGFMMYPGDTCVIVYPAGAPVVTLWPM